MRHEWHADYPRGPRKTVQQNRGRQNHCRELRLSTRFPLFFTDLTEKNIKSPQLFAKNPQKQKRKENKADEKVKRLFEFIFFAWEKLVKICIGSQKKDGRSTAPKILIKRRSIDPKASQSIMANAMGWL